MRISNILLLIFAVTLVSCENYDLDMHNQVAYKLQEYPRFLPPAGSVPINEARVDYSNTDGSLLVNPHRGEKGLLETGKKLFDIYCLPCHAEDGTTVGMPVADKFEMRPADLTNEAVMELTEGEIFQAILDGAGIMPAYRVDLSDHEAWAVTAHVLKLQKRD